MPGNGVGDRVHNFFAQENLSQGLRSQDGNWPLNDNLWVANQKQFGVSDSSPRNYNQQQSDTERGHLGQRVSDQHIFNITQTNPSSNGYMYGRQNFQTRPDKANFMGVNKEYGQNNMNKRGSLFYESQQEPVPEQPLKNPFRSEGSEAHGCFDLFGGQHQTNDNQHPGLLQQQSGFGDIQQLQQQLMRRKMQELQWQQNAINQASQFSGQQASQFVRQHASVSLSHGVVNGTTTSDSSVYGWTDPAVVNKNWLHHASPALQQVELSLHGVPVSSSRGPINQFPQNSSYPANNYAAIPEQHMVPNEGLFGNTFGQRSNSGMKMESAVAMVQDKSATDAASLDPEEEKILFGSDDNIWEAFGSSKNMTGTGGVSSLLDANESASSLPSMQSGSWSALMQSAVAETTSSGDVGVQGDWPETLRGNHPHEDSRKQTDTNATFNTTENNDSMHQSQNNDWKSINTAAILNSRNLPNNHHFNYWKHVDSSMKSKESENLEITQCRLTSKAPQVSESSFNNSSDKEDLRKENSNDSYRSSSSHLPDTVGQRERLSSEADDSRSLSGRKISGPGPQKFQYHPMGNLDEDVGVRSGTRYSTNSTSASLQHHSVENFRLPKSSGQAFVHDSGVLKGSDDMRFKGMVPGDLPNIFTPHDRSVGLSTSDKASQPSQGQSKNMLELLNKVDQFRDGGIARHLNSLERDLSSEIPEPENSDGSIDGHQRSHSSNSQGIGLQLGPPSQRLSMAVKHNSLRGECHAELSTFPPFQETPCGEFKNDRMIRSGQTENQTMMTNLSPALGGTEFRNSRNHLENHPMADDESFDRATSGMSQQNAFPKMLPNASSKLPNQQASQPLKNQQNLVEQEAEKRGNKSFLNAQGIISSVGEQSTEKVDQGQMMNQPAEGNDLSHASQKDLEAFDRSLKPTNFHQQILLLNQMKTYKHTYNNPNNSVSKILNDSDNILHGQPVTVSPGNSEMPRSRLSSDNVDRSLASLPANPPSKDALASDQNGPTSVKIENSHINPQMAPSWFDRYGTLKNCQMSSQRSDAARTVVHPFRVSGCLETTAHDSKEPLSRAAVGTSQDCVLNKTPVPSSGHRLTSQPLPPNITVQNMGTVRPKRRKWSRQDIHSWLKEVSGSSKHLQGIWTASMEWCEAAKRLMEKMEDNGELIEDVPRPKRRVILTTHIMQRLFPPPPTLLSTEATLNYESVAFYAARLALGDACNLVSCVSHRESNLHSDRCREFEKIDGVCLSEAVEECISRVKRLESDFSRLDKCSSILDVRVECQDIEKFSIINRFAKFHGRGQADSEASSLSDAAADAPKPFPQRYVIAVRLPNNLPETVQCLTL